MCDDKEDKQTVVGFIIQRLYIYPPNNLEVWEDEEVFPITDETNRFDVKEDAEAKFRYYETFSHTKYRLLEVYKIRET